MTARPRLLVQARGDYLWNRCPHTSLVYLNEHKERSDG